MLFLAIFTILLILFFGLVNPWVKRHKIKVRHYRGLAFFDAIGGLIDMLKH